MISVDTVYQRVLTLANKEQRGYITPQEFNLLAGQAQMEIFEQYFYDVKQEDKFLTNSTHYSNVDEMLDEKISIFKKQGTISVVTGIGNLPNDLYRLGGLYTNTPDEVEQLTEEEWVYVTKSPLVRPDSNYPAYYRLTDTTVRVLPENITVNCHYIRRPKAPKWCYVVVNEKALYNASAPDRQDFEIHQSDTAELVYKILALAGITIAKVGLRDVGNQEITSQKTQEKQQ